MYEKVSFADFYISGSQCPGSEKLELLTLFHVLQGRNSYYLILVVLLFNTIFNSKFSTTINILISSKTNFFTAHEVSESINRFSLKLRASEFLGFLHESLNQEPETTSLSPCLGEALQPKGASLV